VVGFRRRISENTNASAPSASRTTGTDPPASAFDARSRITTPVERLAWLKPISMPTATSMLTRPGGFAAHEEWLALTLLAPFALNYRPPLACSFLLQPSPSPVPPPVSNQALQLREDSVVALAREPGSARPDALCRTRHCARRAPSPLPSLLPRG